MALNLTIGTKDMGSKQITSIPSTHPRTFSHDIYFINSPCSYKFTITSIISTHHR